jgi:protein SCO1/2
MSSINPAARRGLVILIAGIALLAAGLAAQYFLGSGDGGIAGRLGEAINPGAAIGGPFTLTDQHGKTRSDAEFRGKLMLIYFGYTYCPDVCPTELQTMAAALDRLGAEAEAVQPIFITVDPERDTPEQLAGYVENFHPRLLGLTGTPEQIAAAARAYRVYFAKAKQGEGEPYLMDHSSIVYLMGSDGHYLGHFGPETSAEEMAATIAKSANPAKPG